MTGTLRDDKSDSAGKVLSVSAGKWKDQWIMDLDTSFHMCFYRDWFVTFSQMSGKMYLGDDRVLEVVKIETVQIKMFDGVIRTLECWHVLGLKKNLISFSTLDSKGFKLHGDIEILNIAKGLMVYMMNSVRMVCMFFRERLFMVQLQ